MFRTSFRSIKCIYFKRVLKKVFFCWPLLSKEDLQVFYVQNDAFYNVCLGLDPLETNFEILLGVNLVKFFFQRRQNDASQLLDLSSSNSSFLKLAYTLKFLTLINKHGNSTRLRVSINQTAPPRPGCLLPSDL